MTTREFLISEIQRFYKLNGRVPKRRDMVVGDGYPCIADFINEFGSWNNAVKESGFKTINRITGDEVCIICGTKKTGCWFYYNNDNDRICRTCYDKQHGKEKTDYMNGRLDIDSPTGFAFLSQRVVARKLRIETKHDCNCTYGHNYPGFDLLQLHGEKYGRIQVKTAVIRNKDISLLWTFNIGNYLECDTYIMLGFTKNKSDVEKVWVIPSDRNIIIDRDSLQIYLNPKYMGIVAREISKYEVDSRPYNYTYHNMKKLRECDYLMKYNK